MRILVVERDKEYRTFIQKGLSRQGFAVDVAVDADEVLDLTGRIPYDVIVISGNLTDRMAADIVAALRKQRCAAAVLMANSQSEEPRGRPTLSDLAARLYATLDKTQLPETRLELKLGELRMNFNTRRVEWRRKEIVLTKKEFELLECLMRHPGRVMSQDVIAQLIWNIDFHGHSNIVETHIKRLRAKLNDRFPAHLIQTIRGFGYRLAA